MSRRAELPDAFEPVPTAGPHRRELARVGVRSGEPMTLETRRGRITVCAQRDDRVPEGVVFVPFCYVEAAANLLTDPALDPDAGIPEYKYCAVRLRAGGEPGAPPSFATASRRPVVPER